VVVATLCLASAKLWTLNPALPLWDVSNKFEDSLTIYVGEKVRFYSAFIIHDVFIGTTAFDPHVQKTYKNCDTATAETKWQPASCGCSGSASPFADGCLDVAASKQVPFSGASGTGACSSANGGPFFIYADDITFTKPGTYYIMCTAGEDNSHCKAGMKIKIIVVALPSGAKPSALPYQLPGEENTSIWGLWQMYPNLHISAGDKVEFTYDNTTHNIYVSDDLTDLTEGGPGTIMTTECGLFSQNPVPSSLHYKGGLLPTGTETDGAVFVSQKITFHKPGVFYVGCSFHCSFGMQFLVFVDR